MKKHRGAFWALVMCGLLLFGTSARAAFADVERGGWYEPCVTEMAEKEILTGMPGGLFHPYDTISTSEFVTIAARCAGLAPVTGQTGHWAAGTMEAARLAGWYDWDEIPPTAENFSGAIPRQLAVKVLMRALLPEARGDYNTQSARISDFSALNGRYYEPVLAAYQAGVVTGDGEGCFRPESSLSRAEACALFQRALARVGDPAVPTQSEQPQPSP